MIGTALRGGAGVRVAAAMSLALVVTGATACGGPEPTPQSTAKVERGQVANKVSASGALAPVTTQNLGFVRGGQLTEVAVKVGDTVQPGQVLARIDPFAADEVAKQRRAALRSAQVGLDRILLGVTVQTLQKSRDQAKVLLNKNEKTVNKTNSLNENATERARVSKEYEQNQRDAAFYGYKQACYPTGGGPGSPDDVPYPDPDDSPNPNYLPAPGSAGVPGTSAGPFTPGGNSESDRYNREVPQNGYLVPGPTTGVPTTACSPARVSFIGAQRAYITATTNYQAAVERETVGKAQGKQAVETARNALITAQNTLDAAIVNKPLDIENARALIANAQSLLGVAEKDIDYTILLAPVAGVVGTVNGVVGEFVGTGAPTSALAPGSEAVIPGVGAAAASDAAGAAGGGLSAVRPGGGSFISLNNVESFQMVVPFEESDASKVIPTQKAQVSVDAVPDLDIEGTVLSIAPGGTNISGVTNYYATILLSKGDPRLKGGMTAQADVLSNAQDNVLVVPNSAVSRDGGQTFVFVPGPDGQPVRKPFEPGQVGDETTEVKSGLTEGESVVIPQTGTPPPPGAGSGLPGGGGN